MTVTVYIVSAIIPRTIFTQTFVILADEIKETLLPKIMEIVTQKKMVDKAKKCQNFRGG